jgi:SRSO17 transposase
VDDVIAGWVARFEDMFSLVAGRFGRVEARRRARGYLRGLLAPVERKNGWQLAEAAGDAIPDGMQRLLNFYRWDTDAVRDDLRQYVVDHLGDERAVLVPDETGFVKKGRSSAGVQRQYSGTAGRIENCQLGVFLAYASRAGRALIDRELYLPRSWTDDAERCAAAGVPAGVRFATKPQLAKVMIGRVLTAGVPFGWVAADEAYGQNTDLRRWLEDRGVSYVLAVPVTQMVIAPDGHRRHAEVLLRRVPTRAWERRSCGDGAKGPRLYDWALVTLRPVPAGGNAWLLARRSISDPTELAYYLVHAPGQVPLAELVRVAGARWAVEECFQAAKNEVGLDHYQVRRYDAWYRHITLAMLAYAFLAATCAATRKGTPTKGAAGTTTTS